MYNVGFGDCFLLEFPAAGEQVVRVLIDCGSVAVSSLGMSDIVSRIIDDAKDGDGKARIDVVVCTHRHADHVSGFADAGWRDVEVKEVWFPWTEDPKDNEAKSIREKQSGLAKALALHWGAQLAAVGQENGQARTRAEINQWREIAVNALSNDKAMTMLHGGIRSKPKALYLASDGSPTPVKTKALPGVSAYVLGPSRNRDVIRDMDPPPGETYLRQLSGAKEEEGVFEPFGDDWPIEPSVYQYQWSEGILTDEDREAMQRAGTQWDPAITVALEKAVNGTSLVLVFEIEEAVLFFPGDAQWGTWNAILNDKRTAELLSRANFWKVGHHGSHNATPQTFVTDTVPRACCAMMSTKVGKWESIPRLPLLQAIREKGLPLARSDEPVANPQSQFFWKQDTCVETRIPF